MHPEKYSLTWKAYSDHLRDMMKELMMNDDFADVTLVTEDKKIVRAHKNILSACSSVFKDILKLEQSAKQIIYLRGIQFSEMESIMQFIYLGEATFNEERTNEFLDLAKSLEIKGLRNAKTETNDVEEPSQNDPVTSTKNSEEKTMTFSNLVNQASKVNRDRREVVKVDGKYACDQCDSQFTRQSSLELHIESQHEGIKYACDQCGFQATQLGNLKRHIESKHEGAKYACDQCDYQAKRRDNLKIHIKSKHEGVKYVCDQCDYQATRQSSLKIHIESKHEGVKHVCDQCDYQTSWQSDLKKHIVSKH